MTEVTWHAHTPGAWPLLPLTARASGSWVRIQSLSAESAQVTLCSRVGSSFGGGACLPSCLLSPVLLFATPWTADRHAPLAKGFSRQEHWSGLPFPSPEDLPDPGIKSKRGEIMYRQLCSVVPHLSPLNIIELQFEEWNP